MMVTTPLIHVCVTGPECTGKTTLARQIAELRNAELVLEASRLYAERKGQALAASDVGPIACEHLALANRAEERARARGAPMVVLDTDLVSTVVYSRHYYNAVEPWIVARARARVADLYLLCDVDVAWHADGVRDRPLHREEMFGRFRDELAALGARTVVVAGVWARRLEIALEAVDRLAESCLSS